MREEWTWESIGGLTERIESGGTPSREVPAFWGGGIPWVAPAELTQLNQKYLPKTRETLTRSGLEASGAALLPKGSVLVTTRASVGLVALASEPVATNQGFKSVVFRSRMDHSFAYHLIPWLRAEFARRSSGTTFLEISSKEFRNVCLPVPPLAEQRKIADILDAVDENIRSTERLIDKLERIKQGIADDVFPVTRKMVRLGDYVTRIDTGASPDLPDRPASAGEWGVLKVSAVRPDGLHSTENRMVTQDSLVSRRREVHPGDLLMTRANTPQLVGLACYVGDARPALMLSDKILRIVPNHHLDSEYISHALALPAVRRQIETSGTGSSGSMKNISQEEVCDLRIPWIRLSEQKRIVQMSGTSSARIRREHQELAKLRELKRGLMEDLLTGKVRVNADEVVENL